MKVSQLIPLIEKWYRKSFEEIYGYTVPFINIVDCPCSLIFLAKDGIDYEAQTAGHACHHKIATGILVPVPFENLQPLVDGGHWWVGESCEFLKVNPEIEKLFYPDIFNTNAEEAWIPLVTKEHNLSVILTYPNSD